MHDSMRINEQVTVGPQPRADELEQLREQGFKAVVNLRTEGEEDQPVSPEEEGQQVSSLGMTYHHEPVDAGDLREEQVDRFREKLAGLPGPVYVHCRSGKRAGAFVMMDQAVRHGMSGEATLQKAEEMGFECKQPELKQLREGLRRQPDRPRERGCGMMVVETIQTPGIAQLSYLIGDGGAGTAAVIDPRPDCGVYLDLARRHGLAITHAIETHIHADFMSGSRALRSRLGGDLSIAVSGIGDPGYGYERSPVADGDRFAFGAVTLTARHTPGHTPEHLAYEAADTDRPDEPWGVFTGDSLFVGSVGRPDLLGMDETEGLARDLFRTISGYYRKLDEGVLIFPGHGAGSACGADIGDRPVSSIGREKRENEALRIDDEDAFLAFVEEGAPPVPAHYPRLKKVNLKPHDAPCAPPCPALSAGAFRELVDAGDHQLLDTRDLLAFGGGHVPGAIHIGDRDELSVWAGDMLAPDAPILLVAYDDRRVGELITRMWRVGLTRFAGYLAGGMTAWNNRGLPLATLGELSVRELHARLELDGPGDRRGGVQVLDVRSDNEWSGGRVPGATHFYVGDLRDGSLPDLDKERPVACYCGSGYRASIAASLLQRGGFTDVANVPGSWTAWRAQGLPVEGGG